MNTEALEALKKKNVYPHRSGLGRGPRHRVDSANLRGKKKCRDTKKKNVCEHRSGFWRPSSQSG
jgi:hypothetical protein